MGEVRINGNVVAVFENGTVYAGGSTFWGEVIGYYGGGEIKDKYRKTVAKYSDGTAYALDSFGSSWSSGPALCHCAGARIYEGGNSWNNFLAAFEGDIDGACSAAVLCFSLYQNHTPQTVQVGPIGPTRGSGIGVALGVILALMLVFGVIFIWPALFEVGGWLSVVMIGTQIISHIIVGISSVNGENDSFFGILKKTCLSATISSGILTWLFSGTNILMILASLLIAFLASVGSGLAATTVIIVIRSLKEKAYEGRAVDSKIVYGQNKNYKPVSGTWLCKCGTNNSSNYSICKKCGKYRNTEEVKKEQENREAERISKIILEYNETKEINTWMCVCGTKNKTEHGQCKKCGSYRGNPTFWDGDLGI